MKRYLLPKDKNFYKVNLHCHTTCTDGHCTPEQIKEAYKKMGYSAVAFTDHEMLIAHNDLTDSEFVALHGYEIAVNEPVKMPFDDIKTYHINAIYKSKDFEKMLYFNPGHCFKCPPELPPTVKYDRFLEKKEYSVEWINKMAKELSEAGYFVNYNHPGWSLQTAEDYLPLKNFYGFEVHNTSAKGTSYTFTDYYNMLNRGDQNVVPIASDDNHNSCGFENIYDSAVSDSFGGYNVIAADKLTYEDLIKGLENKDVYASTGVEIKSLYIENNHLFIDCSPASEIIMYRGGRRAWDRVLDKNGGITHAEIGIHPETKFLLVKIKNNKGEFAVTRAYDFTYEE